MAYDNPDDNVPLWQVILTDAAGVILLILVPFLGPLPGPGGIPLLLGGLGLLARNHEWAQNWLHTAKKHTDSLRPLFFPDKLWIKRAWDAVAFLMLAGGIWGSFIFDDNRILKGMMIGVMAGATTVFMMNRDRITWLDKKLRKSKTKKKNKH